MQELLSRFKEGTAGPEDWFAFFEEQRDRTAIGPLGISLVSVSQDEMVLEMPITDAVRQPYGMLHGGASLLLAETASSFHAVWGVDLTRRLPVGLEVSGSHLASASEGTVRAVARVVRRGRSTCVHEVRIEHVESGRLLSLVRVTNLYRSAAELRREEG